MTSETELGKLCVKIYEETRDKPDSFVWVKVCDSSGYGFGRNAGLDKGLEKLKEWQEQGFISLAKGNDNEIYYREFRGEIQAHAELTEKGKALAKDLLTPKTVKRQHTVFDFLQFLSAHVSTPNSFTIHKEFREVLDKEFPSEVDILLEESEIADFLKCEDYQGTQLWAFTAKWITKPKQVPRVRQLTVEGREYDLRNMVNYELMVARTEDVEAVAKSYLFNMNHERNKKVFRACQRELQRVLLLRGKDLSMVLLDDIKLKLAGYLTEVWADLPYLVEMEA